MTIHPRLHKPEAFSEWWPCCKCGELTHIYAHHDEKASDVVMAWIRGGRVCDKCLRKRTKHGTNNNVSV